MDGLTPVPPGHVAAVVTFLEMARRPELAPSPPSPLSLILWSDVAPDAYRRLFRRVGAPWLWYSRLAMNDETLVAQAKTVHEVRDSQGESAGLVELDFDTPGLCLIRFLGLVPSLTGRGHGRWLFAETLHRAWRDDVERVRVHTCSLDHPAALPSYLAAGFVAVGRAFESFPDPRLNGLLPVETAPQIPIVRP